MTRRTLIASLASIPAAAAGPLFPADRRAPANAGGPRSQSRMTPQAKSPIAALVFDAYGTLFDVHSVVGLCNALFPAQGEALSQLWRNRQLEYTWLLSLMDRYEDFWAVTEKALIFACASLKLPLDAARRARLMDQYLRLSPYPEVPAALQALRGTHRLAILSNGSPRMLQAVAESAGVARLLERIVSVDLLRIYKPSRRVYQLASDELGLAPAAIAFVSSNSFDVQGAKSFGFWTCWANRSGAPAEELGFAPDATITDLTRLAAAVG